MAYLAASLVTLRAEINTRWPNRDRASDGWIGDPAHQATVSDHNPDGKGCVHALDVDKDGIDPNELVRRAVAHPATEYVIYNRTIWSRNRGFASARYTGTNPHESHVHVSISHTAAAENSSQPWGLNGPRLRRAWPTYMNPDWDYFGLISGPERSHGGWYVHEKPDVKAIQQRLIALGVVPGISNVNSGWADAKFEQPTKDAVARWQRTLDPKLTSRYGEVWQDDWIRLFTF